MEGQTLHNCGSWDAAIQIQASLREWVFFDQSDQAQITLTLLLSARQDFLCSEEQQMTMSDKFTEGRENPFNYGFRQQVHMVGCLVKQK